MAAPKGAKVPDIENKRWEGHGGSTVKQTTVLAPLHWDKMGWVDKCSELSVSRSTRHTVKNTDDKR